MIRHNFGYKLMALAVAFALWSYVNAERNPQARKTFTVPIEVVHVANGYAAEPDVRDANVTVQGTKATVEAINREDVVATIDVAGMNRRNTTYAAVKVEPRIKETEGDLDMSVSPKTVGVHMEALGDQRLPVEVRFPSVPPLGYAYSNPIITPAGVSISGRVSEVARVKRVILTLPSRMSGKSIDGTFPVAALDAKGAVVTGVRLDASQVRLKLALVEVPATKRVIVSPDVTGSPAVPGKVTRVDAEPSLVTLQGKPAVLAAISTIDTDPVNIDGVAITTTYEVGLRLPRDVTTTDGNKVRVTVRISPPGE